MSWNAVEEINDCDADCSEQRFYDKSTIVLMNEMMNIKDAGLLLC